MQDTPHFNIKIMLLTVVLAVLPGLILLALLFIAASFSSTTQKMESGGQCVASAPAGVASAKKSGILEQCVDIRSSTLENDMPLEEQCLCVASISQAGKVKFRLCPCDEKQD